MIIDGKNGHYHECDECGMESSVGDCMDDAEDCLDMLCVDCQHEYE